MNSPTRPGPDDMNHVAFGIWIGSHYVLKSANSLNQRGIKHVVNAAIEFITENPELINWEDLKRNGIEVHNTYWDDTLTQPIFPSASLEAAVKKIDDVVRSGLPILVNCAMGKSRSTSLVIAYFMARQGMTYDQALSACKRARPQCQPNQNFERQLRQLESSLRSAFPANLGHSNSSNSGSNPSAQSPLRMASPLHQRTPPPPSPYVSPNVPNAPPSSYPPYSSMAPPPSMSTPMGPSSFYNPSSPPSSPSSSVPQSLFNATQSQAPPTSPMIPPPQSPSIARTPQSPPSPYSRGPGPQGHQPHHQQTPPPLSHPSQYMPPQSPSRTTPSSPPHSPFGRTISNVSTSSMGGAPTYNTPTSPPNRDYPTTPRSPSLNSVPSYGLPHTNSFSGGMNSQPSRVPPMQAPSSPYARSTHSSHSPMRSRPESRW